MATTQAQTGSSFTLGDRQDRVLTIDVGNVKITSTSVPEKDVTLTTKRWARFMSIREKVDIKAREVIDVLTFVVFTFHTGLRMRTCVLLAVELVFPLTSGHIYYHSCRLFANSIRS